MRYLTMCLAGILAASNLAALADEPAKEKPSAETRADLKQVADYLAKKHSGKKWQTGPARLEGKELEAAYGKARFYFIHSAPPLPPGANIQELIDAFRKRSEEFRRDFLSLTVRIDEDGKITPLQGPADFNKALMKVTNEEDAKVATAAILALVGAGQVAPGPVRAKDVTVAKQDKGWIGQVRTQFYEGTAMFDAAGRVTSVSKNYAGPVPP